MSSRGSHDLEWLEWTSSWKFGDEPAAAAELRRRAANGRRRLLLTTLGEIALTSLLVVVSLVAAVRDPAPVKVAWAASLTLFSAVALSFAARNRRGTWGPSVETTAGFLSLSRLRCERRRRALRFSAWLFVAEALGVAAIVGAFNPAGLSLVCLILASAGFVLFPFWRAAGKRTARELREIDLFSSVVLDEGDAP